MPDNRLQRLHDAGGNILLRCPMIPGLNTRKDHLDGIAALARRLRHGAPEFVDRVALLEQGVAQPGRMLALAVPGLAAHRMAVADRQRALRRRRR